MNDAIKDLSTITTIPYYTLQTLGNKLVDVIQYSVKESLLNQEDVCEVDIHIGKIIIALVDDAIRFKFIPSAKFEESIIDVYAKKECKIVEKVQDSVYNKIMNAYKDLI